MIISSAIKGKLGEIYIGKRHSDIVKEHYPATFGGIQGFITDNKTFLTRDEAEKHARDCGQLTKPLIGSVLTSEDLW